MADYQCFEKKAGSLNAPAVPQTFTSVSPTKIFSHRADGRSNEYAGISRPAYTENPLASS
jgi:hypothetical protein